MCFQNTIILSVYEEYVFIYLPLVFLLGICIDGSLPKASSDFINLLDGLLQKDPQKRYVWIAF